MADLQYRLDHGLPALEDIPHPAAGLRAGISSGGDFAAGGGDHRYAGGFCPLF